MEKELILRLREIERKEAEWRRKNRLAFYNADKPHLKQLEFHRCLKRNRWVFGGNRTGKTECGAVETVWRARGIHPYQVNRHESEGWVVSPSRQVQREVAQAKILKYLCPDWIAGVVMQKGRADNPSGGIIDYIEVKTVTGGRSVIGFKSSEMGRDKFQGASLDFVWFDEEPPEDIYRECRMRVMDKLGCIYGTMTPLMGLTFVYYDIYLNEPADPETWHIFMEWADNPYLDRDEAETLGAQLKGETLQSRRYGRFVSGRGQVYPEFDELVHVIEPFPVPPEWQDCLSIDPGLNNPLSCHWYAVDYDGNVYVTAEHYAAGRDIDYHSEEIKRISTRMGWRADSAGRLKALIDSAASQRTLAAARSVAELFYERGIAVNTRVDKDMYSGINRVKTYLSQKKLFIFSSCPNMIREFKSYFWASGDAPRKKDDHAMDELRYYIMSRPRPPESPSCEGEIARDKRLLLSRLKFRR